MNSDAFSELETLCQAPVPAAWRAVLTDYPDALRRAVRADDGSDSEGFVSEAELLADPRAGVIFLEVVPHQEGAEGVARVEGQGRADVPHIAVVDVVAGGQVGSVAVTLHHVGWGDGDEWDKAYAYFVKAWPGVMRNLKKRFEDGPINWKPWLDSMQAPK